LKFCETFKHFTHLPCKNHAHNITNMRLFEESAKLLYKQINIPSVGSDEAPSFRLSQRQRALKILPLPQAWSAR
jgi:hypothetical protein